MDSKVASVAAAPDPAFGQNPALARPTSVGGAETPAGQTSDSADLRLVIEEDKGAKSYVYKTVNWLTGEVVQQLPREQILKLREQLDYQAGDVVRTKA